jgi:Tfp pilus assembly protein PilW
MMIAMAVGLVVMAAAMQLFSKAMSATWTVSQKSEMQQDFRAASNLLLQDISLAGSGLSNANIALPSGTGTAPIYGCDQTPKCWINGTAVAYPTQTSSGTVYYMYGLIPGYQLGPTINGVKTDAITSVYTDSTLSIANCYTIALASNGLSATFTKPSSIPTACALPTNVTAIQNLNDAVVGLTPGDLLWFKATSVSSSGVATTRQAVAEVTSITGSGSNYTVNFATGDPLKVNQPTATTGGLKALYGTSMVVSATRLMVVSYYLDNTTLPGVPRLVRQVSGHTPVPVAENVVALQFTYNLYNSGAVVYADGGLSEGLTPNQITAVNIVHLSIRNQVKGTSGYQGMDLQTTISGRNLTFTNSYPL